MRFNIIYLSLIFGCSSVVSGLAVRRSGEFHGDQGLSCGSKHQKWFEPRGYPGNAGQKLSRAWPEQTGRGFCQAQS